MLRYLDIATESRTSRIVVGPWVEALDALLPGGTRAVIVADRRVAELYPFGDLSLPILTVEADEAHKTLAEAGRLYRELIALEADRDTFLLGVGGGVVTDLTGFVAATYQRGIDFGLVATTLLAQVDAALGGKNGVNIDGYKNMAGTIAQPRFVVCDPVFTGTLPPREWRGGLGETIKAALVGDAGLFDLLERIDPDALRDTPDLLQEVVLRAAAVKTAIVSADEHERGPRRLLNLGHTMGHALEKYGTTLSHGEAVAAGIGFIVDLSVRWGTLSPAEARRIAGLLARYGLPTALPVPPAALLDAALHDKKRCGDMLRLVTIEVIGRCTVRETPVAEFRKLCNR